MTRRRYPKYKDSGVEWQGNVPEHWEVKRLKYVCSINDEALSESTDPDFEFDYVDIGSVNYLEGISSVEPMRFEEAPSRARRIVKSGDCIVSTVRTYLKAIAAIEHHDYPLIVSTGFAVIRPQSVNRRYLSYAVQEPSFVEKIVARSTGVSYPAINASEIGTIPLPLPSEDEQTAIADFLDRETGKVDALVEKKRKLIELLKEKRGGLITRTVTRGLPADAAREFGLEPHTCFKDSGIDWLGEIPRAWNILRLKYLFPQLDSGTSVNSEPWPVEKDELGILKTSSVYGNCFDPTENKRITESEYGRATCPVLGDSVIISRMNTPELVGNCGYVDRSYPNLYLPDRLWIACFKHHNKLSGRFAWYLTSSNIFSKLTNAIATGTSGSMKNLSQENYLGIVVPAPSVEEQVAMVTYLDRETSKIDRLIDKVEAVIERFHEYRTALITAAVTGKIDVRDTAA
jgi:type I restriction enzyme S subunit